MCAELASYSQVRKNAVVYLYHTGCTMGLLSQGSPLNWEETKKYADFVRKHGIIQFLNIYNKVKERQKDVLKWGDEVRKGLS